MIEDDDGVHEGEPEDGEAEVVRRPVGQPLPEAHGVVGEVAEEPAAEGREVGITRGAVAAELARERLQRAPPVEHGPVGP